ncbi:MAG: methyltetrahydrofolate cobalamin methyltransferase [Armatimonadota bacterium]|nr:methyltetrahydrofolate cobalamin methyltransferase [Armatimonadota bacterium]
MLIVGERINTSRKAIEPAVRDRDVDFIQKLARDQVEAGATYVDVNAGTFVEGEPEALEWLVQTVQAAVSVPVSLDSPSATAIERALKSVDFGRGKPMINSITAESERFEKVLPLAKHYNTKLVALCMDDTGIQQEAGKRFEVARKLVNDLTAAGIALDDIYVDPLTFPIGTGSEFGVAMLDIIRSIKKEFPGVHVIAGISNISQGLPVRKLLNQAMTILSMDRGLDAAIIDPMDRYLMALIAATRALLGRDEFCMDYITMSREGKFEGI